MRGESELKSIQPDLFPLESAKSDADYKAGQFEQVIDVDREHNRAIIMVEGFEFTCLLRNGSIDFVAFQGADSLDKIPSAIRARAKRRAGGILKPKAHQRGVGGRQPESGVI